MKKNIIDTHIHIWDLQKGRYKWLDGDTSILNRTYKIEELLPEMARTPVAAGVLVQAANTLEDTELMLETARRHEEIIGIVGWLPLQEPKKTEALLQDRVLKEPYFKGVRHLIHNEQYPQWLLQPTVLESLGILAAYNIPFDVVGINEGHLRTAIRVGEKIPALRMVLDHLNQPPVKADEQFDTWGSLMKEISYNGNVYAKISGLGTASGNFRGWTADDITPCISYVLTEFGTSRCFCGGDWPVSTLAGSYSMHWERYIGVINNLLSEEEAEKVFFKNAAAFYNLSLAENKNNF